MSDKRAVSEIVSYVLLIVIAIGISVMAYGFLKLYVPKPAPECPADVSLIVSDYLCILSPNHLVLNISNKGLWKVQGANVRFGIRGQTVRDLITNKINPNANDGIFLSGTTGLMPGNISTRTYTKTLSNVAMSPDMEVQITPIISLQNQQVVCDKALSIQSITCYQSSSVPSSSGSNDFA